MEENPRSSYEKSEKVCPSRLMYRCERAGSRLPSRWFCSLFLLSKLICPDFFPPLSLSPCDVSLFQLSCVTPPRRDFKSSNADGPFCLWCLCRVVGSLFCTKGYSKCTYIEQEAKMFPWSGYLKIWTLCMRHKCETNFDSFIHSCGLFQVFLSILPPLVIQTRPSLPLPFHPPTQPSHPIAPSHLPSSSSWRRQMVRPPPHILPLCNPSPALH